MQFVCTCRISIIKSDETIFIFFKKLNTIISRALKSGLWWGTSHTPKRYFPGGNFHFELKFIAFKVTNDECWLHHTFDRVWKYWQWMWRRSINCRGSEHLCKCLQSCCHLTVQFLTICACKCRLCLLINFSFCFLFVLLTSTWLVQLVMFLMWPKGSGIREFFGSRWIVDWKLLQFIGIYFIFYESLLPVIQLCKRFLNFFSVPSIQF